MSHSASSPLLREHDYAAHCTDPITPPLVPKQEMDPTDPPPFHPPYFVNVECPYIKTEESIETFTTQDPLFCVENQARTEVNQEISLKSIHSDKNMFSFTKSKSKISYKCFLCDFSATSQSILNNHVKTNHESYTCTKCRKDFSSLNSLHSHTKLKLCSKVQVDVMRVEIPCEICGKIFPHRNALNCHFNLIHQRRYKIYKCDLCGLKTPAKWRLKSHMLKHLGWKPFGCIICKERFARNYHLIRHLNGAHKIIKIRVKRSKQIQSGNDGSKSKYKCIVCDFNDKKANKVVEHIRTMHKNLRRMKCGWCKKRFISLPLLRKHIQSKHLPDGGGQVVTTENQENCVVPKKTCKTCNQTFSTDEKLKFHIIASHKKLKIYKCTLCEYKTPIKWRLGPHVASHSGLKQPQCEICLMSYDENCLSEHLQYDCFPDDALNTNPKILDGKKDKQNASAIQIIPIEKLQNCSPTPQKEYIEVVKLSADKSELGKSQDTLSHMVMNTNKVLSHPQRKEFEKNYQLRDASNVTPTEVVYLPETPYPLIPRENEATEKEYIQEKIKEQVPLKKKDSSNKIQDLAATNTQETPALTTNSKNIGIKLGPTVGIKGNIVGNEVIYRCSICNFSDKSLKKIGLHSRTAHKTLKAKKRKIPKVLSALIKTADGRCTNVIFKCNICHFTDVLERKVLEHIETHIFEGLQMSCPICDKDFTAKFSLHRHLRFSKCTPITPKQENSAFHICPICRNYFDSHNALVTHIKTAYRTVTYQMYMCAHCNLKTSSKSKLEIHMPRHTTGERLYGCPMCKVAFRTKKCLKRHVRTMHGKKKNTLKHTVRKDSTSEEDYNTFDTYQDNPCEVLENKTDTNEFLCDLTGELHPNQISKKYQAHPQTKKMQENFNKININPEKIIIKKEIIDEIYEPVYTELGISGASAIKNEVTFEETEIDVKWEPLEKSTSTPLSTPPSTSGIKKTSVIKNSTSGIIPKLPPLGAMHLKSAGPSKVPPPHLSNSILPIKSNTIIRKQIDNQTNFYVVVGESPAAGTICKKLKTYSKKASLTNSNKDTHLTNNKK